MRIQAFRYSIYALLILIVSAFIAPKNKITVYLIGDSTCADKPVDDNPEHGWGQLFQNFFSPEVYVENHAKNGRSTKSFRDQGLWQDVLKKLKPGDYVFIQFGHNDQKISDTSRYAEAHTAYKQNLIKYVEETRAKGAFPVLLTPVNRRKFDAEGKFVDQHGDYPVVVREVAAEMNVPLIDVHKKSLDLFSKLGEQGTKELFMNGVPPNTFKSFPKGNGDNTHFTLKGAEIVSSMVADGIRELNLPLAKFMKEGKIFSDMGNGKVVGLDYYFNREFKKDADGKDYQFHYIWEDKQNSGFSEVGNLIETLGAGIYEMKNAPVSDELKKLSIYVIVDPDTPAETASPNFIDDSSVAEIEKWVKGGGVLMLMANDSANCEFEHLNNLSEKFGIHFNGDSKNRLTGTEFYKGKFENLPDHPMFKGVGAIYLKEISSLNIKEPAEALLSRGDEVIMAGAKYGEGYVFAVGDPWIYNEYFDNRKLPEEFENYKAAKNIFEWLLDKSKKVR